MILDAQLQFSDSQAITAAAGSTNTIDLGVVGGRDIGTGSPLYVVINVEVALSGAGEALTVALEGDTTTTFTPDATENLGVIPALTAIGAKFYYRLDPASAPLQYRYIRLLYTPTTGLTTGTISAHLTHNVDRSKLFADNITIS